MAPRKRVEPSLRPRVPHTAACETSRPETFTAVDREGLIRTVRRCQNCGAQRIE